MFNPCFTPLLHHLCRHLFWLPAMAVLQHRMQHSDGLFVLKRPKSPTATDLSMGPIQPRFAPKPQVFSRCYASCPICFSIITVSLYPQPWPCPFTLTIYHLSTASVDSCSHTASPHHPQRLLNTTCSLRYLPPYLTYLLHYPFITFTAIKMLVLPSILSPSLLKPTAVRTTLPHLRKLDAPLSPLPCSFQLPNVA